VGATAGDCKYVTFEGVPPGARAALVRFAGTSRNATGIFNFRIDADYREPRGGFRPVKVTYAWEEAGRLRRHAHVARQARGVHDPLRRQAGDEVADRGAGRVTGRARTVSARADEEDAKGIRGGQAVAGPLPAVLMLILIYM
jgi:hypothetical protein